MLAASTIEGFSLTLLTAAAGAAGAWLALAALIAASRRPPRIRAAAGSMELPPEPPAVAGLLANDFVLPAEVAPALLLDLSARDVVELDEVQPGRTICRIRKRADAPLTDYERRVLESLKAKEIDGIIPAEALTTGPETQSRSWHRALAKEVIADAQQRGLTHDRWTKGLVAVLTIGLLAIGALLYFASDTGGDVSGDRGVAAAITGGIAVLVLVFGAWVVTRMGQSMAQLPTDAGREAAARAEALERHLHEDEPLADLTPAAGKERGRHFAYAAAFGAAPLAVSLLPMGSEDDHRAWSRFGGRWRRVRVRYPRGWPPAWGKHPGIALVLALFWAAVALLAIKGLNELVDDPWSGVSAEGWEWVERGAYLAMVPFVLVLAWAAYVVVRAVPDLTSTRAITGDVVRHRRFRQVITSSDNPSYWYYLAVDDGSADKVTALRLRRELWSTVSQGDTVTAQITPRLSYVRSIAES